MQTNVIEKEKQKISSNNHRGRERKRSMRWLPIVGIVLLVGILAAARARKQRQLQEQQKKAALSAPVVPSVSTVAVTVGTLQNSLPVTGTLRSNQSVDLSSKISGRIAHVYVDEGDRVSRGRLLVALDDADLRAQLAGAKAQLQSSKVRYEQTLVGLPAREKQVITSIAQARTSLSTAESRYRQAELNFPARKQAIESQVTTAQQGKAAAKTRLEQARETARQTEEQVKADITRAQANLAQAQAALADVKRGSRQQQIAQAEAQVRVQQAQVADAQTELNRQRLLVEGGAAPRAALDAAQTRYNVAKAQLESAQQQLSLVREGSTNEQIRQAEEVVRQSEAGVATARSGESRVVVARAEVNNAQATLNQAEAALSAAIANRTQIPVAQQDIRVAGDTVRETRANLSQAEANRSQIPVARKDVDAAAAQVEIARAAVQAAEVSLGYARIFSTVDGVVNTKTAAAGQAVNPGTTLMNLVALDSVYFEAQISENNVRRVGTNQPVRVNVPAVSSEPLDAYVSDIIPVADPKLRQFRVRITIPRSPKVLPPGSFAQGNIITQTVTDALVVPSDTIHTDDGQSMLMVAQNGQVKRRTVQTGATANGQTQILGGVEKGDQVILGNQLLDEGMKVNIIKK